MREDRGEEVGHGHGCLGGARGIDGVVGKAEGDVAVEHGHHGSVGGADKDVGVPRRRRCACPFGHRGLRRPADLPLDLGEVRLEPGVCVGEGAQLTEQRQHAAGELVKGQRLQPVDEGCVLRDRRERREAVPDALEGESGDRLLLAGEVVGERAPRVARAARDVVDREAVDTPLHRQIERRPGQGVGSGPALGFSQSCFAHRSSIADDCPMCNIAHQATSARDPF